MFSYARGEYFALAFRRGITHGVPAQIVLPFVVAGAMLAWDRWVRRRRAPEADPAVPREVLLLSFLGVLTHPALDWLNVYGMRWGLPFSGRWSYGDTLFIIDPWLWIALASGVFLAGAGGRALWGILGTLTTAIMMVAPVPVAAKGVWLVSVGAVAVAGTRFRTWQADVRRRTARVAATVALAYLALMLIATETGSRHVLDAARVEGMDPREVMLSPAAANPFAAEVEVRTPAGYVPGVFTWLPRPAVRFHRERSVAFLDAPADADDEQLSAVLSAAQAIPDVGYYLVWSRYPYASVRREGEGWRVRYSDARYDGRAGAGGLGGVTVSVPASP